MQFERTKLHDSKNGNHSSNTSCLKKLLLVKITHRSGLTLDVDSGPALIQLVLLIFTQKEPHWLLCLSQSNIAAELRHLRHLRGS